MIIENKNIVYIVIFSTIFIINITVIFKLYNGRGFFEHFTNPDQDKLEDLENNVKSIIFKVFDEVHQRNPTAEEVEKYSIYKNREDILEAIKKDTNVENDNNIHVSSSEIPVVNKTIVEENITESKTIQGTLNTIDKLSNNITFSKSFINSKLDSIQKQIDDIKNLI